MDNGNQGSQQPTQPGSQVPKPQPQVPSTPPVVEPTQPPVGGDTGSNVPGGQQQPGGQGM